MIFFQIKNGKSKTPEINKPSKASEITPEISPQGSRRRCSGNYTRRGAKSRKA